MARISTIQLSTIILVLLCLEAGHTENASEEPKGKVTPSDEDGIYKLVGETLTLNCTLTEAGGYDAEDLRFEVDGYIEANRRIVPSESISSNVRQMILTVSNEKDAGCYTCFLITTIGDGPYIDEQTVYVQKPPREVQNVFCFVYDWDETLSCRWEQGESYYRYNSDTADIDITVHVGLSPVSSGGTPLTDVPDNCPHATPLYETACSWNSKMDHNGVSHFRAADFYLLNITVANVKRPDIKPAVKLHSITTEEIVKPAPVTDLHVAEKNSTCITVAWNHARKHRDKYYRVCNGTCRDQNSVTPKVTEMNRTLCGFRPYTSYIITVQCHPKNEKAFWSDPTTITVTTAEAEPESSFQVKPGSYILHHCSGEKRNITVFWKGLPPEKRNGEIIGYRLIINGSIPIDKNDSSPTSALISDVPCDVPIDVLIFARTRIGPSKTNSRITLYPEPGPLLDLAVNTTDSKVAVAVWNGTNKITDASVNVNMSNVDEELLIKEDNVTIFWCQGSIQTKVCEGEVQWVELDSTIGRAEIPLRDPKPLDYLFGISTAGQAISWTDCLFQERAPKAPVRVEVGPGSSPGQLGIQWKAMVCSYSSPFRIAGYELNICETTDCDETKYTSFRVPGADSSNHVVQMQPGKKYFATVQAFTASGKLGKASEPPASGFAQPVQEAAILKWAIGLVLTGVIVLGVAFFAYCHRHFKDLSSKLITTATHIRRPLPRRPSPSRRYTGVPSSPSIVPGSVNTVRTFVYLECGTSEPEDKAEDQENSAESMAHKTEAAPRAVTGAEVTDYSCVKGGMNLDSFAHTATDTVQPPAAALRPSVLFVNKAVLNSCQDSQYRGYLPPGSFSSDTHCNNTKAAQQSMANDTVNDFVHIDKGTMNPLAHPAAGTVPSASGCMHNGVKPLGKDAGKIQMVPLQPMLQAASPQKGGEINPPVHAATASVNSAGDFICEGVNSAFDSHAITCLPESPSVLSEHVAGQSPEDYLKCVVVPRNSRYNFPTDQPAVNRTRYDLAFGVHSALEEAALPQGTENAGEENIAFDGGQLSPDKSEDSANDDSPFVESFQLSDESPSEETAMLGASQPTPQQAPTEGQSRGYMLHSTVQRTEYSPDDRRPDGDVANYVQLGDR